MPAHDPGGSLVRASSVGVHRGGRWIIHDVNLEIRPGEVVTVVGPNGAGKSTLLKTLLGLYRPDAGNVVRAPGLQIGYVPPTDPGSVRPASDSPAPDDADFFMSG